MQSIYHLSTPRVLIPQDSDECRPGSCHQDAVCYNTQGSFTCQCRPGYYGDGFQCAPGESLGMRAPLRPRRALITFTTLSLEHSGFNLLLMRLGLNLDFKSFPVLFLTKLYLVLMSGVIIKGL